MRIVFAVALAAPLAAVAFVSPVATRTAQAATLFPWCAHYMMKGGGIECGFSTFEQCLRTISGIGGSCQRNVYLEDKPPQLRKARHHHRTHARS